MKFGYARVSGLSQDLKLQVKQLEDQGVPRENIYAEKFTGTKVDRIGRSVKVAVDIVDDLLRRGVKVYVIQLGGYVNNKSATGKMMFNFLTIMAEFEHDMIVDRLATGKAYAKKNNPNYREGRPKRRITNRYRKIYEISKEHSIRETAEITGVSESTVKRIKRQVKQEEKKGR